MNHLGTNHTKKKLAAGDAVPVLGNIECPEFLDLVGSMGIGAVWLEAEHGGVDFRDIGNLTRACDLWGVTSLVRVGRAEANTIYRTLDRGCQGIIVPHVNTREQAELVVDSAKFTPIGHRGSYTSRRGYGRSDYYQTANDETMVVVMIEDPLGIKNLDDILEVDHIDVFFVAPSDLAQEMGHLGNPGHPEVVATVDETLARIIAAGRVAGTTSSVENVDRLIAAGVQFPYISIKQILASGIREYQTIVDAAT